MSRLLALTFNELDKLRPQAILRAVGVAQILAPVVILGLMRLVDPNITALIDPGSIVVGTVVLLAGIASVALTASVFGQEYDLGTVRSLLMRDPSRTVLVAAKVVAILLTVNIIGWIALAAGLPVAVAFGWKPPFAEVLRIILQAASLLPLGCLAYIGASALGSTAFRSTAAGLLLGLAIYLGGFLLSTMRVHTPLAEWSPAGNMLTSLGGVFAEVSSETSTVSAAGAAARTFGTGLALLMASAIVFARQDQSG